MSPPSTRLALLGLLWPLLPAAGCLASLDELTPFPCAADGTCPAGLVCRAEVGCTPATVDTPCDATTDCRPAGAGASCRHGLCVLPCGTDARCPADRICSQVASGGVCLARCDEEGGCPAGLSCQPLPYGTATACLPPATTLPHCLAEESTGPAEECGAPLFDLDCGTGTRCARHSNCLADGRCQCARGYGAYSCAGSRSCVAEGGCAFPDWWCLPLEIPRRCPGEPFVPRRFSCADGRELLSGCGGESCEERCAEPPDCDPPRGHCAAGAPGRCTLARTALGDRLVCTAAGTLTTDQPCVLLPEAPPGVDDCAGGHVCTDLGALPDAPRCRRFCRSAAGCPPGSACLAISTDLPDLGVCLPGCTLFGSCGGGLTCSLSGELGDRVVTWCRAIGEAPAGSRCTRSRDCDRDLTCVAFTDDQRCAPHCDDTHPCLTGRCVRLSGPDLPPGSGYCVPE